MIKIEKYTGTKTYMFPNGSVATPEAVKAQFPAVGIFMHIVETDQAGQVLYSVENLAAVRSLFDLDQALSDDEAIAAIEAIRNTPPEPETPEIDPLDRIATAIEQQTTMVDGAMVDEILAAIQGGVNDAI